MKVRYPIPATAGGLLIAMLASPALEARDPADPGKGFDYVFYGFDPALPSQIMEGSSRNRAMLLIDIDKAGSPRPYPGGPKFKFLAESTVGSGVLEVLTKTPTRHTLIGPQDNHPVRFVFTFRGAADNGGNVAINEDAALEANARHYLRAVVDTVHRDRRTRYLANCPTFVCDVPARAYR
jgi:hypothetical protein